MGIGAAIGGAIGAFGPMSKRSKFRTPQLPTLSQLTKEATGAQRDALTGVRDIFQSGLPTEFLQSQIQSQRQAVPEFAEFQRGALDTGRSLLSQLVGGNLEQRLTQQGIRGAQAARGLSLGPQAAIEEGLAVARANRENQMRAIGLGQQLAQFSAATPFGVEAFKPGIPGVAQNVGFGLSRAGQQTALQSVQQQLKMKQSDAANTARAVGFSKLGEAFDSAGQAAMGLLGGGMGGVAGLGSMGGGSMGTPFSGQQVGQTLTTQGTGQPFGFQDAAGGINFKSLSSLF